MPNNIEINSIKAKKRQAHVTCVPRPRLKSENFVVRKKKKSKIHNPKTHYDHFFVLPFKNQPTFIATCSQKILPKIFSYFTCRFIVIRLSSVFISFFAPCTPTAVEAWSPIIWHRFRSGTRFLLSDKPINQTRGWLYGLFVDYVDIPGVCIISLMGDLRDWSPEPNGAVFGERPSSSSSSVPSNQTAIGAEYWQRAEEATQAIIAQVQPTVVSEERRKAVIDYVQRLIRNYLGCEVRIYLQLCCYVKC